MIDTIIIRTDGAARGNPGPGGVGIVISDQTGRVLEEAGEYIGEATNNVAEYKGLILGLDKAARFRAKEAKVFLDSELLVNQLNGTYKVKNAGLKGLYARAQELLSRYERVFVGHVPRAENAEADRLANEAIDRFIAGETETREVADVPEQGSLF